MCGWRNNPDLPKGLLYEGVSDQPMQFYGETGAQSSVIPAFDAVLGVRHDSSSWLHEYLKVMRTHMPRPAREMVASLEAKDSLRGMAQDSKQVKELYNEAVDQLTAFRNMHKTFAYNYIAKYNNKVGTGGTDFMPALGTYAKDTDKHTM